VAGHIALVHNAGLSSHDDVMSDPILLLAGGLM